jgi:two-component sensor histidine kinase
MNIRLKQEFFFISACFLFFITPICGVAQNTVDKRRFNSLIGLSNKYSRTNYDSAAYYCRLLILEENAASNPFVLQTVYHQMGSICFYDNRFEQSIDWMQKALHVNEMRKDTHNMVLNMSEIALNYLIIHDRPTEASRKWVEKAQYLAAFAHDSTKVIMRSTSLGQYYMKAKNYRAALKGFLENRNYLKRIKEELPAVMNTNNNIGLMYQKLGKYDSAEIYFKHCETIETTRLNARTKVICIINYAINDYLMGNVELAIKKTHQGLVQMQSFKIPNKKIEAFENLANCYISLKRFDSALYYNRLKSETKDAVFGQELIAKVKSFENRIELQRRDKAIIQQNLFIAKQNNQQRFTFFIISAISIILLLVLSAFFIIRKKNKALYKSEQTIKLSLEEKELLLGEIHHRVKNNLQLINGLLGLQLNELKDEAAINAIHNSMNRVFAMSSIHQNLYKGSDFKHVEVSAYFKQLTETVISSIQPGNITVQYDIASFLLPIDIMVPVGLIANELITNAFKYAFQTRTEGQIKIVFKQEQEHISLIVRDNGIGIKATGEKGNEGFGTKLIHSLSRQLKGKFSVVTSNGTIAQLIFPYLKK